MSTIINKRRVWHQVWWFLIKRRYLRSKALLQSGYWWCNMSMTPSCGGLSWCRFIQLLLWSYSSFLSWSHSTLRFLHLLWVTMSAACPMLLLYKHLMLIIDFRSSLEVAARSDFFWQWTGQKAPFEIWYFLALRILHKAGILEFLILIMPYIFWKVEVLGDAMKNIWIQKHTPYIE